MLKALDWYFGIFTGKTNLHKAIDPKHVMNGFLFRSMDFLMVTGMIAAIIFLILLLFVPSARPC